MPADLCGSDRKVSASSHPMPMVPEENSAGSTSWRLHFFRSKESSCLFQVFILKNHNSIFSVVWRPTWNDGDKILAQQTHLLFSKTHEMALSFRGLACYWSCTFLSTWGQRVHFISSAYGRNHDSHHFWSLCVLVLDERVQWISHQCCRKSEIYIFLAYVTFTILIFFGKKKKKKSFLF